MHDPLEPETPAYSRNDLELLNNLFANEFAHEIKNSIYSVAVDAKTLSLITADQPRVQKVLSRVQSSCFFAMTILANMAEIGEVEKAGVTTGKVAVTGGKLASMFESLFQNFHLEERNIRSSICTSFTDFCIHADVTLLGRIFQNLIANAARYTTQGGEIAITFGPGTVIHIANEAEPIPEKYRAGLFEKFDRSAMERSVYARGLNLYFCNMAMAAQGGEINYTATGNKNCFTLVFPE